MSCRVVSFHVVPSLPPPLPPSTLLAFLKQNSKDRAYFFADVIDKKTFDELVDRINERASDKAMDATVRQISNVAGDGDIEDGGGNVGGDDADQNAVRGRKNSLPMTGRGLRALEAQIERMRKSSLSRISSGAAATTMKHLHPETPEGVAAAAVEKEAMRDRGAVQSTKSLGRGRSAAISAATGAFAKAAVKMSRMHLLRYSDDTGKRKVGKPRKVESNFHIWLSDADSIGSSTRSTETATVDAAGEKRLLIAPRMPQQEAVVEMQKMYNLKDRYLRVYLQRWFESERLPRLFSARSMSRVHRYAANDAFEMARKQAARIPPLI